MRKKILAMILVVNSFCMYSCAEKINYLDEFKKEFDNKNYTFAMQIYSENKDTKSFKSDIDSILLKRVETMDKDINEENHLEYEQEVLCIEKLSNDIDLKSLKGKIEEIKKEIVRKEEEKKNKELEELTEKSDLQENKDKNEDIKKEDKEIVATDKVEYEVYYNERYEYKGSYPKFLTELIPPQNGSGMHFSNVSKTVTVDFFAMNNVLQETSKTMYNSKIQDLNNISYKSVGKTYYVVSWAEGENIYYEYCKVGEGSSNGFVIKYPKAEQEKFDPIVTKMYEDFKSGDLSQSY